ncbi:hypothetical protein ABZ079_31865 [Streptomyces sp. NPDC006314]|uniref:hypothetical protein n=1 Tax=Streptomyces sp. NPDC006314 TaxID=3154475 RepID=UPI0033A3A633
MVALAIAAIAAIGRAASPPTGGWGEAALALGLGGVGAAITLSLRTRDIGCRERDDSGMQILER